MAGLRRYGALNAALRILQNQARCFENIEEGELLKQRKVTDLCMLMTPVTDPRTMP